MADVDQSTDRLSTCRNSWNTFFNDILDEIFYKPLPVAIMLIVYGVLFIIVEKHNAGKKPSVTKISQLSVQMLLWIGFFQMLALIREHPDQELRLSEHC